MHYIGTSGYNYVAWLDRFYPANLKRAAMLSFYAQHFNSVEINYTFYRMPLITSLAKWVAETPADLNLALKRPGKLLIMLSLKTH